MRPKARVIVVVWGEVYIDRFAAIALPSFLAPGNLPALAEATELEFLMMTSSEGESYFRTHAACRRLEAICPVRFIRIDDLIGSTVYGVTLTLAYMRGIGSAGDDMVNTYFIFLNSDFVLADGSLRGLLKQILMGRRCVLAPSFRAIAETVEPVLEATVQRESGVLAMKPRDLVALALTNLHPTTVAKTVGQKLCHSIHPNQLYWRIDDQTMLGRFFLIFMLCIRPERVVTKINSYCDYGFVPEMCPSGDITVLADSDEFFMLETQAKSQESNHLRLGPASLLHVRRSLAEWTTREHRRAATFDLLFHSGDLPEGIGAVRHVAQEYVRDIVSGLPSPKGHAFHQYWLTGLEAWRQQLRQRGLRGDAVEIAVENDVRQWSVSARSQRLAASILRTAYRILVGVRPFVRLWHPDWYDYRMVHEEIREALAPHSVRTLFVEGEASIGAYFAADDPRVARVDLSEFLGQTTPDRPAQTSDAVLYSTTIHRLRTTCGEVVSRVVQVLDDGGCLVVVAQNVGSSRVPGDPDAELLRFATEQYSSLSCLDLVSVSYTGGLLKSVIQQSAGGLLRFYHRHGLASLVLLAPMLTGLLMVSTMNNLYLRGVRSRRRPIDLCTTVVLRFRKGLGRQDRSADD